MKYDRFGRPPLVDERPGAFDLVELRHALLRNSRVANQDADHEDGSEHAKGEASCAPLTNVEVLNNQTGLRQDSLRGHRES